MSSIYDNYPAVRYVDEYDKDTDEQCLRCKGNCGFIGITGMWACKGFVPMTQADRIRQMSDEELADFLDRWEMGDVDYSKTFCDLCDGQYDCHDDCLMDWLKSPADKEGE